MQRLRTERWFVVGLGSALLLLWSAYAGRDVNWDLINHHVYLPYSLLSGHYATDLFAAGTQSYQNPVGYLLFYLPLSWHWPNWAVGIWLTLLHALLLLPLHSLSVSLWGERVETRWWRLMAIAFALMTPVFLYTAGTSSNDPLTTVLLLSGLATLVRPGGRALLAMGFLVGLAVAIKPSNGAIALPLFVLSVWRLLARQMDLRGWLLFWGGAALAVLLFWGPWAWWLWKTFGNPVFPLFNHLFASPYAQAEPILAARFLPTDAWDWLRRPFDMALFASYTSVEGLVPDLRPALFVLLLPLWGLARLLRRPGPVAVAPTPASQSLALQLTVFVLLNYVLCMASSGNARYGMTGLMVLGLLLVRGVQDLLPVRIARIVLGLMLVLHASHYLISGDRRLGPEPWNSDPYFSAEVAPRLRDQPFLHLSIGALSVAGIAPLLHPDAAMINLVGQMSMPIEGPLNAALEQRLNLWQGRVRVMTPWYGQDQDDASRAQSKAEQQRLNHLLSRYRLEIDFSDCEEVRHKRHRLGGESFILRYKNCAAHRGAARPRSEFEQLAERVFARVEAACPRAFGPKPFVSESNGVAVQRHYLNTELVVGVIERDGVVISHHRSMRREWLGMPAEVADGRGKDPCQAWERLKTEMRSNR